ncbi:MAG: SAM-dependent chlorinase/fluorinase, partial [Bacteroidota bacterium]|nr:SAM-dependent chlorinase/fluorinase [Bacteroidota bacterium]
MPVVTLMTDFGNKDYSVAAVKGAILSTVENPQIVDISHQISPYNPTEAAYILKNAYKTFPKGSIHIIGVESEKTPENEHLAMYFDGHYFIGADNGIFAMIKGDLKSDKTVLINIHDKMPSTYPVLEIFVWVAAHISRKGTLEVVGKTVDQIKEIKELRPVINKQGDQIIGAVIYVDNYGNVITNITLKLFK